MAATKADISGWLAKGHDLGASHMIVVCDTFDWDDYPVYVYPNEDPREVASRYDGENMQKIMEVYNYRLSLQEQLSENRAVHYSP